LENLKRTDNLRDLENDGGILLECI